MSQEKKLTVEALFENESLRPTPPRYFKVSPDGSCVTFLRPGLKQNKKLSIWRFDRKTKKATEWISPNLPQSPSKTKSPAEKAARERKRQFTEGINHYYWHPSKKQLLIPLDGQIYLVDVNKINEPTWTLLSKEKSRISGVQLSPLGNLISFVEKGNLFIKSLGSRVQTPITNDIDPLITNGLPDFLAAEEMHRFEGHWWSHDEKYIAFCRVNESPVEESYRLEVEAKTSTQLAQRYPYAGGPNPITELFLYDVASNEASLIWSSADTDRYLAKINYSKHGLFVSEQDRSQKALSINNYSVEERSWQRVYHETSNFWINLTDDLFVIGENDLIFSSEESGTRRPIRVGRGGMTEQLPSPKHINEILSADSERIFVSGWDETPIENQLYEINLKKLSISQLTHKNGWHTSSIDQKSNILIDCFSDQNTPFESRLYSLDDMEQSDVIYKEEINSQHPYHVYSSSHAKVSFGEFNASDGQTLFYRLTPPRKICGKHPVINYVYGGPGAQKVKKEWGPLLLQLFAEEGFGVLEIDNRGSTNRGIGFESAIFRKLGQTEVEDQKEGLKVLQNIEWADQDRVGIFGHSYGGYMTLMCLSKAGTFFKSGAAVAPVCDWRLYDSHYTERFMGNPGDNTKAYDEGNVLTHLPNLKSPLLLIHGMADDNVLFTHSTMIMDSLQRMAKPFELMVYPGSKHSMQETHVSIHRFRTILDFFHRTL